jgi:serine/threonine protein kinase/tetratricopeptide (TPR) repeat protein
LVGSFCPGNFAMSDHDLEKEPSAGSAGTANLRSEKESTCLDEPDSIKLVSPDSQTESVSEATGAVSPDSLEPAALLAGNFRLTDEIGRGAVGALYRVNEPGSFAVKLISKDYCRSREDRDSLLESLKKAQSAVSPHLSACYDCGTGSEGSVYLVTDYLSGQTLKELLAGKQNINPDRLIDVFKQVCQALKCLHQHNIVHGNLKPSNIFLVEAGDRHDFAKLVDFGIVPGFSQVQKDEFLRRSSPSDTCVNYMSPEQCLGYALDARSDIYALGLVMYEALSGSPLVSGHGHMHAVIKQMNAKPRPLGEVRQDVPASLEKAIMKCLEKNRADRYASVDDLEMDLDLAAVDCLNLAVESEAAPVPARESKKKAGTEQRIKMALSAVICAGVLACIAVAVATVLPPGFPHFRGPGPFGLRRLPRSSEGLQRLAEAQIDAALAGQGQFRIGPGPFANARPYGLTGLRAAAFLYGLAIDAHAREHKGATDRDYRQAHAAMQARLGELLSRATFADRGGRLDRRTYYTDYRVGANPPKLHPRFPGMRPSRTLSPDYVNAKVAFDQAIKTLDNKFDLKNADLLWDSCFTEFNLGNYREAMDTQQKLIDLYRNQRVQDREALTLSYDNLGRMYLWTGNAGKAVHEFKNARDVDRNTYKMGNGLHTDEINADLAFGFLQEGKYDVSASIARDNLQRLATRSMPDPAMNVFNTGVLSQALSQMGKKDEADKLELQLYRSGQIMQPMP